MAGIALATISPVLNLVYGKRIIDAFRRDAVLPNLFPVVMEANSTCTWPVRIAARNTAAPKAAGYDVQSSDYSTDVPLQASLAWAHYEAYASITGTAQRIAAANKGFVGGRNALDGEIKAASEELAVKLSTHTYSGDYTATPPELAGIAQAIDAAGTYAAIIPGSYADWAASEETGSLSAISIDMIRTKVIRKHKDQTGRRPDFMIAPGAVFDAVAAKFDASTTINVTTVRTARGPVDIAALGFTGIMIDQVPLIEDRHCTSNTIYSVDAENFEYVQVPPDWLSLDPGHIQGMLLEVTGSRVPVEQIEAEMRAATQRLTVQINALAKSGDSTKVQAVIDLQLRMLRRNRGAKLTLS